MTRRRAALRTLEEAKQAGANTLRSDGVSQEEIDDELAVVDAQMAYLLQLLGKHDRALTLYTAVLSGKPRCVSPSAAAREAAPGADGPTVTQRSWRRPRTTLSAFARTTRSSSTHCIARSAAPRCLSTSYPRSLCPAPLAHARRRADALRSASVRPFCSTKRCCTCTARSPSSWRRRWPPSRLRRSPATTPRPSSSPSSVLLWHARRRQRAPRASTFSLPLSRCVAGPPSQPALSICLTPAAEPSGAFDARASIAGAAAVYAG